jgi:site-specific recombinase XerD
MVETASDLVTNWAAALANTGRPPPTRRRYASAIHAFITWYEQQNHETFDPKRITPIDLTGYRNQLQQQAAPSTVNVHVCALRSFCAWLAESNIIDSNPAVRLKVVGLQAPLAPKALTAVHVNALLRESLQTRHAKRDYALIQLLIQTGMRIGECAALRLGDVQIGERQGQVTIRSGKGNKSRIVPLNSSARRALVDYLASLWDVEASLKTVVAAWPQRPVAVSLWRSQKGGGKLSIRAISAVVEGIVEGCGHRNLVPHDTTAHTLRHSFATSYLKDHPGDLVGLAALLGHSSLETTRIYVQPGVDDLARRVEATRLNAYD